MGLNTDYDAIQQKIHSGEIVLQDGRSYKELSEDEKAAVDNHFDELRAKQAEEKEAAEKEKEYQEGLDKFKEYAHENIRSGSGKSYDEMSESEKKAFDTAVEEYYAKRMGADNNGNGDSDDSDSEPNTDMERGMSRNSKRPDDDEKEYVR